MGIGMFYVATGLILVGLGLILFYIFADAGPADMPAPRGPQPAPASAVNLPGAGSDAGRPGGPPTRVPAPSETFRPMSRRVDPDALASALRGASQESKGPPPLALQGILFLKPDRSMPESGALSREGEQVLGAVRRVGEATVFVESGRFLIRAGDASFSYSAADLEEVVFEQGGFSFIPVDRSRPVPVFLSERPDELRNYLRANSVSGVR